MQVHSYPALLRRGAVVLALSLTSLLAACDKSREGAPPGAASAASASRP